MMMPDDFIVQAALSLTLTEEECMNFAQWHDIRNHKITIKLTY